MRLYIPIPSETFERLKTLARAERRDPHRQAVVLIERALADHAARNDQPATAEQAVHDARP